MTFWKEYRILIKVPKKDKSYSAKKLKAEFPNKPWTLSDLIK